MDTSTLSNGSKALDLRHDKQLDGGAYRFRSMSVPSPDIEASFEVSAFFPRPFKEGLHFLLESWCDELHSSAPNVHHVFDAY